MDSNVSPEEVQAIMDTDQPDEARGVVEVQLRDFSQPRRLSPDQIDALRFSISQVTPAVEEVLLPWLRQRHELHLTAVGEVGVETVFEGLQAPFVICCFRMADQPGWTIWENSAAQAALEVLLGSDEASENEARDLSPVELVVTKDFLARMTCGITEALGKEARDFQVIQSPEELQAHLEADEDTDRQRTFAHLTFDGPGGESVVRLYLPALNPDPNGAQAPDESSDEPPVSHLEGIPLEVGANLGSAEVLLADLLKLEIGDVIPLGVQAGSPVHVTIANQPCGTADWGNNQGRLVLRMRDCNIPDLDP